MTINFSTNKIVIACYQPGAGGKFVLNCLGLSKDFVLQDPDLAQQDLDHKLATQQKLDILLTRINQTGTTWNDLELGADNLFGISDIEYVTGFTAVPESFKFNSVVHRLSYSDKMFASECHQYPILNAKLKVWNQARVLLFDNDVEFATKIRPTKLIGPSLMNFWQRVRGDDWPDLPPINAQQYHRLPTFVRQELETLFVNEIYCYINDEVVEQKIYQLIQDIKVDICQQHQCFTWDCNWFWSWHDTLHGVQQLYSSLGLCDFDEEKISNFYQSWRHKVVDNK